ncbi:MAG TPA: FAD binding domain-containing protein [Candidatus Dormibacteraeota bacterium]
MEVTSPRSLADALEELAAEPGAVPLAGGTDLMVAVNFGRERPARVLALRRVEELRELSLNGRVRCGAGVTYTRLLEAVRDPAMVQAARTVGSPQIRNAGTLGGNLGTCSPAGDTLPVLAALDADVVLRSAAGGERRLKLGEWMRRPKKSARHPEELVVAAEWDAAGPAQAFLKAGTRNAMVIAVANLALVVDRIRRRVGVATGSVGPTIVRASAAEEFARELFTEAGWDRPHQPSPAAAERFGQLCAEAAAPIDDVRGTAAYRRHMVAVMARRALARTASTI